MPEEEVLELKFRLYDGSDIGPFRYSPASTIAMLKDRIFADWPRGFFFFFFIFNLFYLNWNGSFSVCLFNSDDGVVLALTYY